MEGIFDKYNSVLEELAQRIEKKKEQILSEKLLELGILIDFEEEKKRTFKRFMVKHNNTNDSEEWYYNDGSIYGKRVITFVTRVPDFDFQYNKVNQNINLTWF